MTDRALPHHLESERIVLGSMMMRDDACLFARQQLSSADFIRPSHGVIFDAIRGPVDPPALAARLGDRLEEVGGPLGLLEIHGSSSFAYRDHVELVRSSAESRRVVRAGTEIAAMGYDGEGSAAAIARAMQLARPAEESMDLASLLEARISEYGTPTESFLMPASSVRCHFGDVTILAGRPGTGKTAYSLVAAFMIAKRTKCAFFSYEMTLDELADRLISHIAQVSTELLYEGLSESEQDIFRKRVLADSQRDFTAVGCSGWNEARLEASLRMFASQGGKLVVIDYLQIAYDVSRSGNENADLTRLSKMLRTVAKSTGLAIIAVSQFRRFDGADDADKRITYPKLSDLRGSGSLEQDAANVCLMYAFPSADTQLGKDARAALYERERLASDLSCPATLLRLDWAKVRHGASRRRFFAFFDGGTMSFEEIDREAS